MGDKETLGERVNDLLINPVFIQRICIDHDVGFFHLPNTSNTQKSLQIYAYITNNESMITPDGAKKGLKIYGKELRAEAKADSTKHPSITELEKIARKGKAVHSHIVTDYSAKPIPEHVRYAMPKIAEEFGTPVHIYNEDGTRKTCKQFNSAFSWNPGFRNFFAVKACPNPALMDIMLEEGFGADCSSAPELTLAKAVGMSGEDMMFTSNDTPDSEFKYAKRCGAIVNLDDITHIEAFERAAGRLPELLSFRFNPGEECDGNSIIGNPVEAKYGVTREQIFDAYRIAREKGVKRFGLHTMIASNDRNLEHHVRTAKIMLKLAQELKVKSGVDIEFINLGGGVGTPYHPWDKELDLDALGKGVKEVYDKMKMIGPEGVYPSKIFMECGRAVTGPHGWLLTGVRHVMKKHRDYIGVDATMADLMRPGMYGAYHHLTVLGKENAEHNKVYDVVGSLCENCDKFAVQRFLPEIERGDLIAIHNSGAHGRAMCFNYNAKLRSGEVLVHPDGSFDIIRRHETEKDYFATLDFKDSKYAHLAK